MDIWIALLTITALVWFWGDSMKAREVAIKRCSALCEDMNVQLLDQTVRVARLRVDRNRRGQLQIRRFYVFDFSIDGQDRWFGVAILLGQTLEYIRMEHPQGPIVQDMSSNNPHRPS